MESSKNGIVSDRILRLLAWLLVGIYFILSGTGIFLMSLADPQSRDTDIPIFVWILQLVVMGIWPIVGGFIINKHPRHPVGWLLFPAFPNLAITIFAIGYIAYATSLSSEPVQISGAIAIWLTGIGEPFAIVAITWMNLLFPSGKLLSPRWRVVGWGSAATLPVILSMQILKPGPLQLYQTLDNPYAAAEPLQAALEPIYYLAIAILLLCSLASVISLFLRLRRSRGYERQQVKWLVIPAFVYWLTQTLAQNPYLRENVSSGPLFIGVLLLIFISVPLIVIVVAVAIFRYRLYDIDIIIRRTLVYGALTASLAVIYFSSVVLLQGLFVTLSGQQSAVAVVISTLVISALFNPLRRRIQDYFDWRFYRKKYVAEKVIAAFSAVLREQADLEQLSERLLNAVDEILQPESLSLWLKEM